MNRLAITVLICMLAVATVRADQNALKAEAEKYGAAVLSVNKRLFEAGQAFRGKLGYMNGRPTDAAALKDARKNLAIAVSASVAEMKAIKVPAAKSAGEFHKLHQKFLDQQEGMLDAVIKPLVELAERKELTDAQRKEQANAILRRAGAAETAMFQELRKLHYKFAEEFGIAPALVAP